MKLTSDATRSRGVTLIELMVVTFILVLLAAIALPRIGAAREQAYLSALRTDLMRFSREVKAHFVDYYTYAGMDTVFVPSDGVTATCSWLRSQGYLIRVDHAGLSEWACYCMAGNVPPRHMPPVDVPTGVVACIQD